MHKSGRESLSLFSVKTKAATRLFVSPKCGIIPTSTELFVSPRLSLKASLRFLSRYLLIARVMTLAAAICRFLSIVVMVGRFSLVAGKLVLNLSSIRFMTMLNSSELLSSYPATTLFTKTCNKCRQKILSSSYSGMFSNAHAALFGFLIFKFPPKVCRKSERSL